MGVEGDWSSSQVKGSALVGSGAKPHEVGIADRARRTQTCDRDRRIRKQPYNKICLAPNGEKTSRFPLTNPRMYAVFQLLQSDNLEVFSQRGRNDICEIQEKKER